GAAAGRRRAAAARRSGRALELAARALDGRAVAPGDRGLAAPEPVPPGRQPGWHVARGLARPGRPPAAACRAGLVAGLALHAGAAAAAAGAAALRRPVGRAAR